MLATNLALVIRPDATFDVIDWPADGATLRTLYTALNCDYVDMVDVSPELSMWLDDSGITIGSPVNIPATNHRGDTIGLTREQCDMVLGIIGIETPTIPHQHTK
ncbi:DUF3846 domain-containing protein [Streptomyces sp. NBC_01497]|uniref:DUF3846 domain-containing protein n=1 Tax=Streptomyces sp. NBC_01497 TaxID=2903885 RepID=UPI002E2F3AD3|nr:DUF3846 domain-containing protein [Streptomyces sp. NBC_01497]